MAKQIGAIALSRLSFFFIADYESSLCKMKEDGNDFNFLTNAKYSNSKLNVEDKICVPNNFKKNRNKST